ncbi:GyrI-like domain-containing protein [Eggerthellaceae bacterium 3-80]|nr:transcriptional regulator [bacterium D16-34]
MPFDYKKEYKEIYQPSKMPSLIEVPPISYVAVRGKGDPNEEGGEYQRAIQLIYGISYTIKMSPKSGHKLEGYLPYVVPPLEGFWTFPEPIEQLDPNRKTELEWISCIRLPEFVTPEVFDWSVQEATRKKKSDFSKVEMITVDEGLCVQCMHIGSYDDEPATVDVLRVYAEAEGMQFDQNEKRLHHEIYLSDPRRTVPERLKTVLRIPVKPV